MIPGVLILITNMFRSKLGLSFSLSIISLCLTTVEPTCSKGCDLALGSYYVWTDAYTRLVAEVSGNSVNELISYNPGTTEYFILSYERIFVPFPCDCIDGEFLAHVFTYAVRSGDTYDKIAETYYSNLTTAATLERSNSYSANSSIPVNATVNVTVNCSCGNASVSEGYGLFVTYPLRAEDSLESIANTTNFSTDLLQRYNPGANFNAGSGLVYIPGRGLSGGVIAGISLGVAMGALLVSVCIYCGFYKKKKVQDKILLPKTYEDLPLQAVKGISVDKSVEFSCEELAKATDEFSIGHKIGQGGFGSVYYAVLQGEQAAIKKMDMRATREFLAELKVLTRVHHLNLVRLIGYCVEGSLFLVYEYIENGNLSQHLHGTGWDPLPWSTRVQIALDSARGLEYIHEHTVPVYIHRDIKTANIMIDKNFRAKQVADFGLAKLAEAGGSTRLVGTFGYMPPEYAQYCCNISPKVDVYAFGVVLYELISAKEAIVKSDGSTAEAKGLGSLFEEALNKPDPSEDLCKLIDPRLGDNYPLDSVLKMAQLAKACTQVNRKLRPGMRSVVVALMTLSSSTEPWDVGSLCENKALVSLRSLDSLEYSDQTLEDFHFSEMHESVVNVQV
ncbi:lysM domain receptor-like kinase 3 isoform X1 [Rhododendron vialii]|uniref:lysM domain receptor-like kinase 3 isoform X1 n=1 Tax=Rhododendron vialii TaxID=182163 RepID=UPI00265E238F|nr:lysM domain receptor-like kinase 3 isoform X1 [Rhododendron vialii]